MFEIYKINCQNGRIAFEASDMKFPEKELSGEESSTLLAKGWIRFCNMGDPAVLSCTAYRKKGESGGIFVMQGLEEMFIAHADSNLAFSLGLGYFARLVSDIRYASDIWEEMEDGDA